MISEQRNVSGFAPKKVDICFGKKRNRYFSKKKTAK